MTEPSIAITDATTENERAILRALLVEFHEWLSDHETSYDPEAELSGDVRSLERASENRAWIARLDGSPAGCVLLVGATDDLAEFKRLWVRPTHRGEGIGRALVRTVIDAARTRGYETLGLTTPPWSETAQALYESIGFERTPPYPETRLPERYHDEAVFMKLDLTGVASDSTDESR